MLPVQPCSEVNTTGNLHTRQRLAGQVCHSSHISCAYIQVQLAGKRSRFKRVTNPIAKHPGFQATRRQQSTSQVTTTAFARKPQVQREIALFTARQHQGETGITQRKPLQIQQECLQPFPQ